MTPNDNDTGNEYGWLIFILLGGLAMTVFFLTRKSKDPNSWENYPTTTTYTTRTSGSNASETLSKMGYKDIQENGMTPFVCPEDEYSTVFSAKDPAGKHVSGVVCCPLLFGRCSVRHNN